MRTGAPLRLLCTPRGCARIAPGTPQPPACEWFEVQGVGYRFNFKV